MPFYNPIDNYRVTGSYGDPRPGHVHGGVDIVPATGQALGYPVTAANGGVVTVRPLNGAAGNMISIDHGDGYVTNYMHLNDFTVQNGQTVVGGQRIGHIGNTGTSTGPHLHYEVVKDGVKQNPNDFLSGRTGPVNPGRTQTGNPPGSSASPPGLGSSSADKKSVIETDDESIVQPQSVERKLDFDESSSDWKRPTDPHEPYYAGAEIKIGGVIVAPWHPLKPITVPTEFGDIETPGIDLRLEEFQFRFSYTGASVALIRIFVKAWTDVVETMRLCAMQNPVEFTYGYTNIKGGVAGPFYGYVVSVVPQFLQNGYTISIEVHDKDMIEQSNRGAKRKTWKAKSGKVSDIVKVIADQNGWASCIEETMPVDPEKNNFVQKDLTDFTFIKTILAQNARSNIPRTWIKSDGGRGYAPYDVYLKYSPKIGKQVLHFHPGLPSTGTEAAQPIRNFKWGGVMDAARHEIGTVIDFKPEFRNQAFLNLGGSWVKGVSVDIFKKKVHVGTASGSDVTDSILPGSLTMESKLSSPKRARAEAMPHREADIMKVEMARRHFALRDQAWKAQLTVVGDPFLSAGQMINVLVVRPNDGVMMFYDWWIDEAIHTIIGGEFTTTMTLTRMAVQTGYRPGEEQTPGLGVGMLNQQSSVSVDTKGLVVGSSYDPDGVQ